MDFLKNANQITGATLIKNLQKRQMEGYFCESKEEAMAKIIELIPQGSSVAWGGSQSLKELDFVTHLSKENYILLDRDAVPPEQRKDMMRKAFSANAYLMSSNAITLDGELVNIDGSGNRVAALCYGPDSVIVVVGTNKITTDIDCALKRVKTSACPANSIRIELSTPCAVTGKCGNCLSESSICAQTVVTRLSREKGRIKVIIVNESLGY